MQTLDIEKGYLRLFFTLGLDHYVLFNETNEEQSILNMENSILKNAIVRIKYSKSFDELIKIFNEAMHNLSLNHLVYFNHCLKNSNLDTENNEVKLAIVKAKFELLNVKNLDEICAMLTTDSTAFWEECFKPIAFEELVFYLTENNGNTPAEIYKKAIGETAILAHKKNVDINAIIAFLNKSAERLIENVGRPSLLPKDLEFGKIVGNILKLRR